MNIERAIQDRWQARGPLRALLPVERLFTGLVPDDPPPPYAVLTRLDTVPVLRTSSGTALCDARIELSIWAGRLELLQQIVAEAERCFERAGFALADGLVLLMRRVGLSQRQEESGLWRATLAWLVLHETPSQGVLTHV